MIVLKTMGMLLKETFSEWQQDKASRLAAALAYYTVFSIAPVLLIVIVLAGLVMDPDTVRGEVYTKIEDLIGRDGTNLLRDMVNNVNRSGSGLLATLVGVGTLVFGASGAFNQLKDSLNTIWNVAPGPRRGGLRRTVRDRLLSITFLPAVGFLLLVTLAVDALLSAASGATGDLLPDIGNLWVWRIVSMVFSFAVITVLFAAIYKVLPDVEIEWRDVGVGAAVTALLFTLGRVLIGLYLGSSSTASAYGAAGSLIVLLLWVYYSAQILFLGAEFTQVYARYCGKQIRPKPGMIRLTLEDRIQQGIARDADINQADGVDPVRAQQPSARRYTSYAVAAMLAFLAGVTAGLAGRDNPPGE